MPRSQTKARSGRMPRSARRIQLLAAAQEVFVSQGFHAAAMDEIADRAGVSKPVLYQHFQSKLDLYLALLEAGADELVAKIRTSLASTRDNRTRVQAAVSAYFEFVDDSRESFRLLFESDLFNETAVRDRVHLADAECADLLAKVIAEDTGRALGEATVLAYGLIGMAQTAARQWLRAGNGAIDRAQAAELVANLGWRGISGFPASTYRPRSPE